jgi:hypothetical protein
MANRFHLLSAASNQTDYFLPDDGVGEGRPQLAHHEESRRFAVPYAAPPRLTFDDLQTKG